MNNKTKIILLIILAVVISGLAVYTKYNHKPEKIYFTPDEQAVVDKVMAVGEVKLDNKEKAVISQVASSSRRELTDEEKAEIDRVINKK